MTQRPATAAQADPTDVSGDWNGDNQDWWDWYVSLADNPDDGAPLADPGPLPDAPPLAAEAVAREMAEPYPLSEDDRAFFALNGFVKLKGVLSDGAVAALRAEMARLLPPGADGRFRSLDMIWPDNPLIRALTLSPRIAKLCADLLGVRAVRLYHDNLLSKEPGCGRTPWHYDDHHFPLDTQDVVTAWIPAQPIPRAMGPLAFAKPLEAWRLVESAAFNTQDVSYDRAVAEIFRDNGVAVEDGPFASGEVSFHHNRSFHTAAANRTTRPRMVLANTYYADGARVMAEPTLVSGAWRDFLPGVEPGGLAASPMNPVCWPADG